MSLILAIFLGVVILVLAVTAIYHKNTKVAIIATGAVRLFASVLHL